MSWLDNVGTQHPPGFWDLPEDEWTEIQLDLDTAQPDKDARNWSILKMDVDWGNGMIASVLEFWSHNALKEFLGKRDSGKPLLKVMRHKVDGKNQVRFRTLD